MSGNIGLYSSHIHSSSGGLLKDLPNLDLIRSMAVISVVVEHLLIALNIHMLGPIQVAWIGVVGVFVFFIHTALVLMWSMERRPHVLDFYIRRIFRIYPLAIVAILIAVAFRAPVAGAGDRFFELAHLSVRGIAANLTLVQNLFNVSPIESVMWSLPLEVQMYVVLPALFFFVQRNFAYWPVLTLMALDMIVSQPPRPAPELVSFAPYFLSGIIAYIGFGRRKPNMPSWLLPAGLIVVGALFLLRPGFRAAWFLCLLIGFALPSFRQIRSQPLKRASHAVAKYSYGIYLSHPFALVLGIYLLPHSPILLQVVIVISATAIFSVAAYHLLELPMMQMGSRLAARAEARYEQRDLAHYRSTQQ
jgi:peptidoglycan/LPS O-acetylase OafA/YrhL